MASPSPSPQFAAALDHYRAGRLAEARKASEIVRRGQPNHGGAFQLEGLIALRESRFIDAARLLKRAQAIAPALPAVSFNLGCALAALERAGPARIAFERTLALDSGHIDAHCELAALDRAHGRLDAAVEHLRQVTQSRPDHAEAWNNLGTLLRELGQHDAALASFLAALAARPGYARALNNLGTALKEAGRPEEALARYREAIDAQPHYPAAHDNLGQTLLALGRPIEAIAHFRLALEQDGGLTEAALNLGLALDRAGAHDKAEATFRHLLEAQPAIPRAWFALADALDAQGRGTEAADALRRYLELEPADTLGAGLRLAVLGVAAVPDKAPEAYVRSLFDQYADNFDEELTQHLAYEAPTLLLEAVQAVGKPLNPDAGLDILDLGCGTGLTGMAFRPMARFLAGVDLSPRMIEHAQARGIYDFLAVDDVVAALRAAPHSYDLIVAGDVLVYFGDLRGVALAAVASLRLGGLFAFTVESLSGQGFELHDHHRYAHSRSYLETLAAEAGLAVVSIEPVVTRYEGGHPVDSLAAVLQRVV